MADGTKFVILKAQVNDDHDAGNVQIQIGNEHAVPSQADLDACRPSVAELEAELEAAYAREREASRQRVEAAQLADQQMGVQAGG